MKNNYIEDIPQQLAVSAFSNVSHSPEGRAERIRKAYADRLASDYEDLKKNSKTPEQIALIESEFERYREGCKKRYLAYLASYSRCASWFVTGPSNFPAARMEKRHRVVEKRLSEINDYRSRAISAIRCKVYPGLRPIMSGDADAVERLAAKLAKEEEQHEKMLDANRAINKYQNEGREAQIAALLLVGFTEGQASKLLVPNCFGIIGFASYRLRNSNARLRNMRGRLEALRRNKTHPVENLEGENAGFEDNPAENRVRLRFEGKPDFETRTKLKKAGFRWAPSLGVWQAYRNPHSIFTAKEVAGVK